MIRLLVVITSLILSSHVKAEETPVQFIERYVGYFNAEDLERYQTTFVFPVTQSMGGQTRIFSDPTIPMANFENIKKTGWVESRIDVITVLSESPAAALVEFSFSRMDAAGHTFLKSTGYYGLVNTDTGWKIQSMFFVNPLTVGTE